MRLDRDRLIRAREMLGYGIETTAQAAGVSKNSVLRAEHGEDIRPVTARKIARALNVEVADLLGAEYPKVESRSSLEPTLFYGLEDERRPYDFRAAAAGLHRYCSHWERKLRETDFDYQALKEFFIATEHWYPILQTALDAELNQLAAETGLGFGSDLLAKSEIWQACDRYIELGVNLANAGNERFDPELEEEQRRAEKRRATFTVYAGGLSA